MKFLTKIAVEDAPSETVVDADSGEAIESESVDTEATAISVEEVAAVEEVAVIEEEVAAEAVVEADSEEKTDEA